MEVVEVGEDKNVVVVVGEGDIENLLAVGITKSSRKGRKQVFVAVNTDHDFGSNWGRGHRICVFDPNCVLSGRLPKVQDNLKRVERGWSAFLKGYRKGRDGEPPYPHHHILMSPATRPTEVPVEVLRELLVGEIFVANCNG